VSTCAFSSAHSGGTEVTVARALLSDIRALATNQGATNGTLFQKYLNGSFSSPGVTNIDQPTNGGGDYAPLFATDADYANFPSVAFSTYLNQYVMAYSLGAGSPRLLQLTPTRRAPRTMQRS
jgi:hypothetical protein